MATSLSFGAIFRNVALKQFKINPKTNATSCNSKTSREILPALRTAMRPIIESLVELGGLSEEQLTEIAAHESGDAVIVLVTPQSAGAALQSLSMDLPRKVDGKTQKNSSGVIIRTPNSALLVRDPWSNTDTREGSRLFTLRAEFDRCKLAKQDTFPKVEQSLESADAMYAALRKSASADRWSALSLLHRMGG